MPKSRWEVKRKDKKSTAFTGQECWEGGRSWSTQTTNGIA